MTAQGARARDGVTAVPRGLAAPVAGLSDAEIMTRARERPEWFAEIYRRHFAVIRRYLGRRVAPHTADDIAAETFASALAAVDRYSASYASARPWLYGIASNLLRQHLRSHYRERAAHAGFAGRKVVIADLSTRAAERLDAAREAEALRRGVEALRGHERVVLQLRIEQELTYEETAAALGIPVGTVRSRLARARARLSRS